MADNKCKICGGNLVITIGSNMAVCDHCGQSEPVSEQDVKKYLDIYKRAEVLMRTGTLSGFCDASDILQSISFIPQAREKAEVCKTQIEKLKKVAQEKKQQNDSENSKGTVIGIVIIVLILLLLSAALFGIGYLIFHLVKGDISQTGMTVLIVSAVVLVALTVIGKLNS